MKTALQYIAEARQEMLTEAKSTINSTCGVTTQLDGSDVTVIVTKAKDGPENSFGDKITGFAVTIKGGNNDLAWPLFGLANIDSKNSLISSGRYAGFTGDGSLWYTEEIKHSSIFSGQQEAVATVSRIELSQKEIKVFFSPANTKELAPKYTSFQAVLSIASLFGPKGNALVDNLKSKDWQDPANTYEFDTKYTGLELVYSQNAKIKFIVNSK